MTKTARPYNVWRRDDGYVAATCGPPSNSKSIFEILLVTDDWREARDLIEATRAADPNHDALLASWCGSAEMAAAVPQPSTPQEAPQTPEPPAYLSAEAAYGWQCGWDAAMKLVGGGNG